MTAVKDGQTHLAALDVDREVFLDGKLISRAHSFRTYDWAGADRILSAFLEGNDTPWAPGQRETGR